MRRRVEKSASRGKEVPEPPPPPDPPDPVDETLIETFPASDPPAWWAGPPA